MEVSFDEVWRHFTYFTFVGTVLLHSDTADQAQLFHQSLDYFVVHRHIAVVQLRCDTSVSVSALVLIIDSVDGVLGFPILIWLFCFS